MTQSTGAPSEMLGLASTILAAYVSKNRVPAAELPTALRAVYGAVYGLAAGGTTGEITPSRKPAVPIKRSITPEHIVCLEDGKKLKMLKRYLRGKYGLSPDEYRAKWGLPRDYPMVAPNYAAKRSEFAKQSGLGRKRPWQPKRRKRS